MLYQVPAQAGATVPAHRHPGPAFGNVLEGELFTQVQGENPNPVTLK
jgi:quercetin dioxygenase-like cupin family protein